MRNVLSLIAIRHDSIVEVMPPEARDTRDAIVDEVKSLRPAVSGSSRPD